MAHLNLKIIITVISISISLSCKRGNENHEKLSNTKNKPSKELERFKHEVLYLDSLSKSSGIFSQNPYITGMLENSVYNFHLEGSGTDIYSYKDNFSQESFSQISSYKNLTIRIYDQPAWGRIPERFFKSSFVSHIAFIGVDISVIPDDFSGIISLESMGMENIRSEVGDTLNLILPEKTIQFLTIKNVEFDYMSVVNIKKVKSITLTSEANLAGIPKLAKNTIDEASKAKVNFYVTDKEYIEYLKKHGVKSIDIISSF